MRQFILSLRRNHNINALRGICAILQRDLPQQTLLAPIPGWKAKSRTNALPEMMCRCLERPVIQVLKRSRPTVGQHRLNRRQRVNNQRGSFSVQQESIQEAAHSRTNLHSQAEVWLVDDIVTTGATVMAADQALQAAGIKIRGVLCLARTP